MNDAASRMPGHTREEMRDMSILNIDKNIRVEDRPRYTEMLRKTRHAGFETEHTTEDGKVIPVEITENYLKFNGQAHTFCFVKALPQKN